MFSSLSVYMCLFAEYKCVWSAQQHTFIPSSINWNKKKRKENFAAKANGVNVIMANVKAFVR